MNAGRGAKGRDRAVLPGVKDSLDRHGRLVDESRRGWAAAEWERLASLQESEIAASPERAETSLLVAAAHLQLANPVQARAFLSLARSWGIDEHLVRSVLVAGLHRTLARACDILGDGEKSRGHLELAGHLAGPGLVSLVAPRTASLAGDAACGDERAGGNADPEPGTAIALMASALPARVEPLASRLTSTDELVATAGLDEFSGLLGFGTERSDIAGATTDLADYGMRFRFAHVAGDYIPGKIQAEGRFYESEFLTFLSGFYRPGGLIVDVGANIGNHTVFFAKVIGADVVAFEPEPHNALCLALNIVLNGIGERVTLMERAVGDRPATVQLRMAVNSNYGSFASSPESNPNSTSPGEGTAVQVEVVTIDSIRLDGRVSIMKVDVEGMEPQVLGGALRTIERDRPVLAIECFTEGLLRQVEALLLPLEYFPIELVNVTPTFIFVCRASHEHMRMLSEHLRDTSISKAMGARGFRSG